MALRASFIPPLSARFDIAGEEVSILVRPPSALTAQTVHSALAKAGSDPEVQFRLYATFLAEHVVDVSALDDGDAKDPGTYLAWPAVLLGKAFAAAFTVDAVNPQSAAVSGSSPG